MQYNCHKCLPSTSEPKFQYNHDSCLSQLPKRLCRKLVQKVVYFIKETNMHGFFSSLPSIKKPTT